MIRPRSNATKHQYALLILLLLFLIHSCLSFHSTLSNSGWIGRSAIFHCTRHHVDTSTTSSLYSTSKTSPVEVYNNVINDAACRQLHNLSLEHTKRSHDGSSLFYRGSSLKQGKFTPIETTIDQILTALNDTSPMVEYWSRSSYINMDAHADIDENTLKEDGVLRCPRNGHVLYMQIANSNTVNTDESTIDSESNNFSNGSNDNTQDDINRMGPTVIFPNKRIAWGSVTPRTIPSPSAASYNSAANLKERVQEYIVDVENYWSEEEKLQYGFRGKDNDENNSNEESSMAIVPAVNGRLLRFDGAAFHSVPKPPERYLLSEAELAAFLENECEEDCDDEDGYWDDEYDDYDDDDDSEVDEKAKSNQRSVLLFNTWPEGSSGPRGVLPDQIVDVVPDGIVLEDDETTTSNSREEEQYEQWQSEYGTNFEKVWCNPYKYWVSENVQQLSNGSGCSSDDNDDTRGSSSRNVRIPLMGNPTRRGVTETEDVMMGYNVEKSAFLDGSKVSLVMLDKHKSRH